MAAGERGEEGHTKTRRHEGGGEGGRAGLARGEGGRAGLAGGEGGIGWPEVDGGVSVI